MGLRLPSESLLWLLGGVGGKCRWSAEAEEQKVSRSHSMRGSSTTGLGGVGNQGTSLMGHDNWTGS